mgnify:CR=1 FL=1
MMVLLDFPCYNINNHEFIKLVQKLTHFSLKCIHKKSSNGKSVTSCQGHIWPPRYLMGDTRAKVNTSKIEMFKICRFWQTDLRYIWGYWPCWVQIWPQDLVLHCHFGYFVKSLKQSDKLVGQIINQIHPC